MGNASYNTFSGKGIEGVNGFYKFDGLKWRYKPDALPVLSELAWSYATYHNNVWTGRDGGSERLYNLFVIIPRGNGWKGNHTDKELLLVNTGKDLKITGALGVCERI